MLQVWYLHVSYVFLDDQYPADPRNVNLVSILYPRNQAVLGDRLRVDQNMGATNQPKVSCHQSLGCSFLESRARCQQPCL